MDDKIFIGGRFYAIHPDLTIGELEEIGTVVGESGLSDQDEEAIIQSIMDMIRAGEKAR